MIDEPAGKLIVFEGPDGVGKTTLINSAAEFLNDKRIPFLSISFPGKTPGTLGEVVDEIHHNPENFKLSTVTPLALQALHIAAHLDAIEQRIQPALNAHKTVLLDRIWWSTWVYGHSAGVNAEVLNTLIAAEKLLWNGTVPVITFLIERTSAFRPEHSDDKFKFLSALYDRLATEQSKSSHVVRIANNDLVASQETVRESIASLLRIGTLR